MDPLKLLSRSTKISAKTSKKPAQSTPSGGENAQPQLFPAHETSTSSKKRKRDHNTPTISDEQLGGLDFFGTGSAKHAKANEDAKPMPASERLEGDAMMTEDDVPDLTMPENDISDQDARAVLKKHKLKVTWLNPKEKAKKEKRKSKSEEKVKKPKPQLFPHPLQSFRGMKQKYEVGNKLAGNIEVQGYDTPTEVQLGALPLLLEEPKRYLPQENRSDESDGQEVDLLTVAPTGSGKTLAFMIPLLQKVSALRRAEKVSQESTVAIVLAPTKELAGQTVNEGRKLANGTGIKITQLRKGMRIAAAQNTENQEQQANEQPPVKADVIVSTPGLLFSSLYESSGSGKPTVPSVRYFVLDEADVLLDPLFREQTLGVWNALNNPALRVSLWSATMGSNIEELTRSTIDNRRKHITDNSGEHVPEAPLIRLVVGLKDSAVPNIDHKLVYAATEQGKLMGLRHFLHPTATSKEAGPPLLPPFLVFTQTIERAIALHSELLYDIPIEAGGISRIAVLHSDLSDSARDSVMTRFRKGEIWVLITTDLLSRGVDFRGVNGVVNYDIPTSSAAYVHRVGRTGRAGREGGMAVTLYSKEDIPYLKHVANIVATAQKHRGAPEGSGMQQWLLDALPSLSKQEKQKLKKRGVESRTSRGKESDPKAARRAKISSKSGYVRKEENKRKGAVAGSKRRKQMDATSDQESEADFGGFD
ncbi:P-loop containing nucleoside triphosphate hydrolase protein [Hortaea werneckii]|nr:P-loop containing nucleoside triphosphate hydrolase protein [Hortaea werneckii]